MTPARSMWFSGRAQDISYYFHSRKKIDVPDNKPSLFFDLKIIVNNVSNTQFHESVKTLWGKLRKLRFFRGD